VISVDSIIMLLRNCSVISAWHFSIWNVISED